MAQRRASAVTAAAMTGTHDGTLVRTENTERPYGASLPPTHLHGRRPLAGVQPADAPSSSVARAGRARDPQNLHGDIAAPTDAVSAAVFGDGTTGLPGLIGRTVAMQHLFARAIEVADSGRPVLISGRAGSGKSALARAMHQISKRSSHRLQRVRCSAFPDSLLPPGSEQATGPASDACLETAFTDSTANGTLVLDEIGDLPFRAQTTLLRLLARATGGVHVIGLTHIDLEEAVAAGQFRSDLLHRLSEIRLRIPDLRVRQDDLGLLAERFRDRFQTSNPNVVGFSDCAVDAMRRHAWPGNVRELRNRIERAMLVSKGSLLSAKDLGLQAI